MAFEVHQDAVAKLLNDCMYRIPRNQRRYVWDEQNWRDLLQDLLCVVDGILPSHFIGSVVLMSEGQDSGLNVFTIIDGQQRLITLTLLLDCIVLEFKRRGRFDWAAGAEKYLMARDVDSKEHIIVENDFHLTLSRLTQKVAGIEASDPVPTNTRIARDATVSESRDAPIVKGFSYFARELAPMSDEQLAALRDAVIGTTYISITATTEEDSYTIFEILNARGTDLEDHELLKNFLMRYVQPQEERDKAQGIWNDMESVLGREIVPFLKHYATHACPPVKGDRNPGYRQIKEATKKTEAEERLYDLRKKAGFYLRIADPRPEQNPHPTLLFLKAHRVRVFRPLLLSLMSCRDSEDITDEQYDEALDFIYRFYVCSKSICGINTNRLVTSVAKYAYELESAFTPTTLDNWKQSFVKKLPSREAFEASLCTLGWSHHWGLYEDDKRKENCRIVLEILEKSKSQASEVPEFTIEHVLPDAEDEANALIGNLLPLENHLNARCKDLPLEQKLPFYSDSCFATTRGFAKRYKDRPFDPKARVRQMTEELYKLLS